MLSTLLCKKGLLLYIYELLNLIHLSPEGETYVYFIQLVFLYFLDPH